jgi:hypothetical protein
LDASMRSWVRIHVNSCTSIHEVVY